MTIRTNTEQSVGNFPSVLGMAETNAASQTGDIVFPAASSNVSLDHLGKNRSIEDLTDLNLASEKKALKYDLLLKIVFVLFTAGIVALAWHVLVGMLIVKIAFSALVGIIDLAFVKYKILPDLRACF